MTYTPTMFMCDRQLSGTGTVVTLGNIPTNGYSNLIIKGSIRTNVGGNLDTLGLFFNNDLTLSNYRVLDMLAGASGTVAGNYIVCNGNGATAGYFGNFNTVVYQYSNTSVRKVSITDNLMNTTTGTINWYTRGQSWDSFSTITRIDIKTLLGASFISGGWIELWATL